MSYEYADFSRLENDNKLTRTNHLRAILTTKFSKKIAAVFSKQRFDFACKTIKKFQKYSKTRTQKSTSFGLNVLKMWC